MDLVSSNEPRGKGEKMWCRVADEPVVVTNPQPKKAGNRPEDETGGDSAHSGTGLTEPKALAVAKG